MICTQTQTLLYRAGAQPFFIIKIQSQKDKIWNKSRSFQKNLHFNLVDYCKYWQIKQQHCFWKTAMCGTLKPLGGAQCLILSDFRVVKNKTVAGRREGIINSWGPATAPSRSLLRYPSRLSGPCPLEECHWLMWQDGPVLPASESGQSPLLTANQLSPHPSVTLEGQVEILQQAIQPKPTSI